MKNIMNTSENDKSRNFIDYLIIGTFILSLILFCIYFYKINDFYKNYPIYQIKTIDRSSWFWNWWYGPKTIKIKTYVVQECKDFSIWAIILSFLGVITSVCLKCVLHSKNKDFYKAGVGLLELITMIIAYPKTNIYSKLNNLPDNINLPSSFWQSLNYIHFFWGFALILLFGAVFVTFLYYVVKPLSIYAYSKISKYKKEKNR